MKIYKVGGAVRDRLLGLPLKDRDWVVVGATEEQMLALGYRRADAEFPVFLHPETGEEYALARRETKTGPGYKGFAIYAGPDVTLEEDLRRRDLTINAIAEDERGQIIDPLDGQADLRDGLLRHITPAFAEDPVRLLRVARFAARLGRWGFRVAHGTHALMKRMAASEDLAALKPERVWQEMRLALASDQPWRFFEVLHRCHALGVVMPGLAAAMGGPGGHGRGAEGEPVRALKRAAVLSDEPSVRFAAIMLHAVKREAGTLKGVPVEREFLELLELALALEADFQAPLNADATAVMRVLEHSRALQRVDRFQRLLLLLSALQPVEAERSRALFIKALQAAKAVTAQDLMAKGLRGRALGEALKRERTRAVAAAITT